MSRFIESLCCDHGEVKNIHWHQARVDKTFERFFSGVSFQLKKVIVDIPAEGHYKCRIVYDQNIRTVHFQKYVARTIQSLKLVEADFIDYSFKYEDRTMLETLYHSREDCDDIIIVKNGLLTDSYYANLALFDGDKWYTPKEPLLSGTKRAAYLHEGLINEALISPKDLKSFQSVSLINAMLDLGECLVPVENLFG